MNNKLIPQDASACVILTERNGFVMQLRDDIDDIFFPGRWGFFGGAIESNETFKDTIVREIFEELSIKIPPDRFKNCGEILLRTNQINLVRKFFILNILSVELNNIRLTEGQCWQEYTEAEVRALKLTPYDEYFFHMICDQMIPDRVSCRN